MTAAPELRATPLTRPRARAPRSSARRCDGLAALLFLALFLVIYMLFLVHPYFRSIWMSLHD